MTLILKTTPILQCGIIVNDIPSITALRTCSGVGGFWGNLWGDPQVEQTHGGRKASHDGGVRHVANEIASKSTQFKRWRHGIKQGPLLSDVAVGIFRDLMEDTAIQ